MYESKIIMIINVSRLLLGNDEWTFALERRWAESSILEFKPSPDLFTPLLNPDPALAMHKKTES